MVPNCVEFPVTWLAIARMGAVSIQVNPQFTASELDYVLNDAYVDFIVLDESCLPAFKAMAQRSDRLPDENVLVGTEAAGSDIDAYRPWSDLKANDPLPTQPLESVSSNDLMSLLYTSGTTGFPKGCMLDHRYWVQIATVALQSQAPHTPQNSLIYEPMFYIKGNALFLASLLANATVYCSARASIANFLPWVDQFEIDYCAFPVPAAQQMEQQPAELGKSLQFVHAWYFRGDALSRMER
jgi:acyl-coenzyme A synthetase/AMP-(fatty) acid ligase